MDGDGDPDLSRHPEPPARTPQQTEEQERRRLLEAKKPTKTRHQGAFARHQGTFARLNPFEPEENPSKLQEALARRRHSQPSSSRQTRSSVAAGAGTATRVRQSVLYSDRPRRSRGRRGRALSDESAYDTASSETYSEIIEEEKPKDESDYDLEEERCEIKEYLEAHRCNSVREACDKMLAAQRATPAASCDNDSAVDCATQTARIAEWVREQPRLLWWHKSLDSLLPTGQASPCRCSA